MASWASLLSRAARLILIGAHGVGKGTHTSIFRDHRAVAVEYEDRFSYARPRLHDAVRSLFSASLIVRLIVEVKIRAEL